MANNELMRHISDDYTELIREYLRDLPEKELSVEDNIDTLIDVIKKSNSKTILEKLSLIEKMGNLLPLYTDSGAEIALPPRALEYVSGGTV